MVLVIAAVSDKLWKRYKFLNFCKDEPAGCKTQAGRLLSWEMVLVSVLNSQLASDYRWCAWIILNHFHPSFCKRLFAFPLRFYHTINILRIEEVYSYIFPWHKKVLVDRHCRARILRREQKRQLFSLLLNMTFKTRFFNIIHQWDFFSRIIWCLYMKDFLSYIHKLLSVYSIKTHLATTWIMYLWARNVSNCSIQDPGR